MYKINIYNRQKALPLSTISVRTTPNSLFTFLSIPFTELSLYFITSEKITALHSQFFNDPTPTDCITFPLDAGYLGDVFICPEAAIQYAPIDPYTETLLYIVHGFLHLIGHDDLKKEARRTMRKMEKRCMDHLNGLKLKLISS